MNDISNTNDTAQEVPPNVALWQRRTLFTVWLTYGSFYFCRVNISTAVPGLQDLGLDKAQIGMILAALKISYAIGQFINGQLADRLGSRRMLAIGMFASAVLNMLFGFGTALYFFLFVWLLNGYAQAMWPACVKVMAHWFPSEKRGTVMGIIGVSYQLGAALTLVLCGWLVEEFGDWRLAFWVPSAIFFLSAIHTLARIKNRPEDVGLDSGEVLGVESSVAEERLPIGETLRFVFTSPKILVLAFGLFGLDFVRYGFLDWAPAHLKEVQGTGIGKAALKAAVLPLGGCLGALLSGWITDRFFGSRRAPMITIMLLLLGLLTLGYNAVVETSYVLTVVFLGVIGFMIYGPQILLVGTAPQDFSSRRTAASAAGFVDCVGYLGAFAGTFLTGVVAENYGWRSAIWMWAGVAFATAALVATLWNAKPMHEGQEVREE